ncbi:MAG: L,D-transpeptidase [Pseudolabrys sp.]
MMKRGSGWLIAALAVAGVLAAAPAKASLLITIDKSIQHMTVEQDGLPMFNWPVSTGIAGRDTPSGDYKPFRMEKDHYSVEWDDAPMPNSIFFSQTGHAIHGSFAVKQLGTPASHGCVRLAPQNAAALFKLVKQEKMANTRVVVKGDIPITAPPPVAARPQRPAPVASAAIDDTDEGVTGAPSHTAKQRARDLAIERAQQERDGGRDNLAASDARYYYDRQGRRYLVIGRDSRGLQVVPADQEQMYRRSPRLFNWN